MLQYHCVVTQELWFLIPYTTGDAEKREGGGGGTFKLSTMFLLTACCIPLNGTVVPSSSDTLADATCAVGAAAAAAGTGGEAAAADAGAADAAGAVAAHIHETTQWRSVHC